MECRYKLRCLNSNDGLGKYMWYIIDTKTKEAVTSSFGNNPIMPPPYLMRRIALLNTADMLDGEG